MEEKNIGSFLTLDIVLLIVFIGHIMIIFDLTGRFMFAHLLFFVLLVIASFISLVGVYYNLRWGWLIITLIFSLIVLDELFVYLLNKSFGTVTLVSFVASLSGLILSISNLQSRKSEKHSPPEGKIESIEKVEKAEKQAAKSSGKYVAGKTGKTYHSPNCHFVKNINKENQFLFSTKEEAASKGLKPHKCIN